MRYVEIEVVVDSQSAEIVSTAMFSVGAEGLEIKDPKDYEVLKSSKLFWDYVDDNAIGSAVEDGKVIITTLIDLDKSKDFIRQFEEELSYYTNFDKFDYKISTRTVDKSDWSEEWKNNFKPIRTTKITIIPIWDNNIEKLKTKTFLVNPSIAFGSGEHATTRMCLEYMDVEGKDVIDIGCGSGILGLSAKILGAKSVLLIDIDENAVKNAKEHAEINKINDVVIRQGDLIENETADVIFANLTADILIRLSKKINKNVREGGKLVISGIITEREEEVVAKFKEAGFHVVDVTREDPWVAMVLMKNAD